MKTDEKLQVKRIKVYYLNFILLKINILLNFLNSKLTC